jgi:hypothetical protein
MARVQNNPSIGWVHPKSAHVHPLTWGQKNFFTLWIPLKEGFASESKHKDRWRLGDIHDISNIVHDNRTFSIVNFEKNNLMKKINYCWNGKSIITLEISKTHISNELSTQPYNHTSSHKHHDPPSNSHLLLEKERTPHMQMLFSLLYITYNKQTKTQIYVQIHINFLIQ